MLGKIPERGAMSSKIESGLRRSQGIKRLISGSTSRAVDEAKEGREGRSEAVKDALDAVIVSAQAIAESSSIPFVPQIAAFLVVLAKLSSDFGDNEDNMPKTVRWCGSMLKILDKSSIHTVVNEVSFWFWWG